MKSFLAPLAVVSAAALIGFASSASVGATDEWKAPHRAAQKKNPVAADDASLAAGKKVYTKECLPCHGTTGKGDGPKAKDLDRSPGDLTSSKVGEQSDGALFWKITTGRKPMPEYETTLSDTERWHVVNFLRTFTKK